MCVVALLGAAAVSTAALAGVQIGPSGPNAEVGQYVDPGGGGGGNPPDEINVINETGAGGELAFTGFVLLPLIMVGVLLILGAVALRRRAGDSPVPA